MADEDERLTDGTPELPPLPDDDDEDYSDYYRKPPGPRFGSRKSDRIIIAVVLLSVLLVGLGIYGIVRSSQASGPPQLSYRLAYSSTRNGQVNIYMLNRDGSESRVTSGDLHDEQPSWSPDGKTIVFQRNGAIWVHDDSGTRQVSAQGQASYPHYSPDGTEIAYADQVTTSGKFGYIWLMNADGTNQHNIFASTDPNARQPDCFGGFVGGWSPAGDNILYRGSRADGTLAICTVKPDGSDPKTLILEADPSLTNFSPAYSPDGTKIAFVSNREGKNAVFIANADGSDPQKILTDAGNEDSPSWSPDGQWIAFTSDFSGHSHVYMMHPDGSDLTQLTKGNTDETNPSWAPN